MWTWSAHGQYLVNVHVTEYIYIYIYIKSNFDLRKTVLNT